MFVERPKAKFAGWRWHFRCVPTRDIGKSLDNRYDHSLGCARKVTLAVGTALGLAIKSRLRDGAAAMAPYAPVDLHSLLLRPLSKDRKATTGGVLLRPTARQSPAASMVDYCAGVLNLRSRQSCATCHVWSVEAPAKGSLQHGVCGVAMALAGLVACGHAAWADDHTGAPSKFETVPAAEASEIDETAALTIALQGIRAATDKNQKGRLLRGVHPKSHGCVAAEFVVNRDIEEKYRAGLFAQPGNVHDAWIRFSKMTIIN